MFYQPITLNQLKGVDFSDFPNAYLIIKIIENLNITNIRLGDLFMGSISISYNIKDLEFSWEIEGGDNKDIGVLMSKGEMEEITSLDECSENDIINYINKTHPKKC